MHEGRFSSVSWLVLALRQHRHAAQVDLSGLASIWRYNATDPRGRGDAIDFIPINILCMDGGGIRGRCLLAMVEELEAALGGSLSDHFDLIAGTSIGGCGSIFLSQYPEAGQATKTGRLALTELQSRCFREQHWWRLLRQGHLCLDARRDLILEICGPNRPLKTPAGSPKAFAVAARRTGGVRGHNGLDPFLFRTYDLPKEARTRSSLDGTARVALWKAVEATSAVPVLFPRAKLEFQDDMNANVCRGNGIAVGAAMNSDDGAEPRTVWLADGGLVANDPTAIALQEARALWPNRPIGIVLSLGTGIASPLGADTGEPARTPIGRAVRACGGPSARYYRLNPPVRGVSMIDCDENRLMAMEAGAKLFFRQSVDAREACARLSEARARHLGESMPWAWPRTARWLRSRGSVSPQASNPLQLMLRSLTKGRLRAAPRRLTND